MSCVNCSIKDTICKESSLVKNQSFPGMGASMPIDFIKKGFIEKNDKELYKIIELCDTNSICYYRYAQFIYDKYKYGEYTHFCSEELAIRCIIDILYWTYGNPYDENNILKNLYKYKQSANVEKFYRVKERNGQRALRDNLIKIDCRCKICGLSNPNLLITSHIIPWKSSNNSQRVDIFNAFLLCPTHNTLFDRGYISFTDDGNILISEKIEEDYYDLLNINKNIRINVKDENKKYLKWHRDNIFNTFF